jgi:hypothetical protein
MPRSIDRCADEAKALVPTAGQPSFLQAMVWRAILGSAGAPFEKRRLRSVGENGATICATDNASLTVNLDISISFSYVIQ